MKTESNIKPKKKVEFCKDTTRNFVIFNDLKSIEEVQREDETIYVYNSYQFKTSATEEYVNKHKDELFELAKQEEYNALAEQIRTKRNKLLDDSDKECLVDRQPTQEMLDYRQALRDITKQEGFPFDVVFPIKP